MSRTRVIYNAEGLFVGPTPATGQHYGGSGPSVTGAGATAVVIGIPSGAITDDSNNLISGLTRIQDIGYGFNINRTDVYQFGELSRIDSVILDPPTVNLNFSYLQANLFNERILGFKLSSGSAGVVSAFANFLDGSQDEKNYFIRTATQGSDLVNISNNANYVFGIGNGFISSYSTQGAVGGFPTSSLTVEGLNMKIDSTASGNFVPAVKPTDGTANATWKYQIPMMLSSPTNLSGVSALRPGDITVSVDYNDGGVDTTDWKVQSYNINYNISREPLTKLGSKFPTSREIKYPLTATASITANVGDAVTGSLVNLANTNTSYKVTVNINNPGGTTSICNYQLLGAKLDSQNFSSSVGPSKSVTLNFSASIGGTGVNTVGVFMSGLST